MKPDDAKILEQLQAVRASYAARLPNKLDEIDKQWQVLNGADWDPVAAEVLQRQVHSLAGSGSTFGFPLLGEVSRSMEQLLKSWAEESLVPNDEQRSRVENLIAELHPAAIVSAPEIDPGKDIDIIELNRVEKPEQPVIVLIEDNASLNDELAVQLVHFGYRVKTFAGTTGVKEAVAAQRPDAFITDINLPEGSMAGVELMSELQRRHGPNLPVIFISSQNDFTARLAAVRAGGEAYFVKPLEVAPLIDRLDRMTRSEKSAPYRILAVDDDQVLAAHYELVLRQAGMEVRTVTRAEDIMETLADFKPELILMDVYMPSCSGLELAKLIRQHEAYLGIPIVFLSTETSMEKQFTAMHMGGDDFLTKPIQGEHLVSAVAVRAERARILNALMDQDSLTGLLKHTMIKEQLAQELSRARREQTPLSFVMIDIDNFKSVNDNYGHMMGDRVIKSMARMLKQRLRKSDRIGRYGGEEFAIVLPNCDLELAGKIIDKIRTDFSELCHQHEGNKFAVTFSAGISSFPAYESADEINRAADDALYQAKNQGRNCIVLDSNMSRRKVNI